MKNWILLIATAVLFACQHQNNEIVRLGQVRDSLLVVSAGKDSAIFEFLASFNAIQQNLDSIKSVEKLVTVARQQHGEQHTNQKERILQDLALLNQLMQKNKALNADLQVKLATANKKIGNLEGLVAEFEKMVDNLNVQMRQKDMEIVQLNKDIERLNFDITQLASLVQKAEMEVFEKTEIIERQTHEMNLVFYAMGTPRELIDHGILEKSGGVLGMGRTLRIRKDFNRDYFSQKDMRELRYLPLHSKRARVITVHPAGSFRISGEKSADTLFIDHPGEFWKASRYLLLVAD